MRVGELATIYGINRQSIYKRIKKGEGYRKRDRELHLTVTGRNA